MRAINLYVLTRKIKSDLEPTFEKALSQRDDEIRIRKEELEQIKTIVANLLFYKVDEDSFDNWFYSFTIPQIGKEFDLLKIGKNKIVINIELKSQEVSLQKVKKQLVQNQYYLSNIASKIHSFTYTRYSDGNGKLFYLDKEVKESSFEELIKKIKEVNEPIEKDIQELFSPKDYLISPINTPDKFLYGKYYLNQQQQEIKKKIIKGIGETALWGIKGSAGTGKTLLLYDIAKELAVENKVCIVHCGILSEGHKNLTSKLKNIDIIQAKDISKNIDNYSVICVDETQRIYSRELDTILNAYKQKKMIAEIFCYDFEQALSRAEIKRNNPQKLANISGFQELILTKKIRTNKVIFSFIRNMLRLNDKPQKVMNYKNIDILFANDINEGDRLINIYIKKGYTFISFTPSQYVNNSIDHYASFINSHQVIGQEFDNVVLVMDNNFRYSEKGELEGRIHPNPDYLFERLFYQNISRVREKLCIIVLQNEDFFEKLLLLKENKI